jgi:hypothetical protein
MFSVESSNEALLDADRFEDLPGKWQAAILKAEQNHSMGRIGSATLSERDQPTLHHVLRHARPPAERRRVADHFCPIFTS